MAELIRMYRTDRVMKELTINENLEPYNLCIVRNAITNGYYSFKKRNVENIDNIIVSMTIAGYLPLNDIVCKIADRNDLNYPERLDLYEHILEAVKDKIQDYSYNNFLYYTLEDINKVVDIIWKYKV